MGISKNQTTTTPRASSLADASASPIYAELCGLVRKTVGLAEQAVIAQEIVEDLQAALEQFRLIAADI